MPETTIPETTLPADRAQTPEGMPARTPVAWLLQGSRLGDNLQVLALGAVLERRHGWQTVVKRLKYRRVPVPGPDIARGTEHVATALSDELAGPWPDLVISIGRRAAPVGRWICARNSPAGVHVHLGRFFDPFDTVDLLVTTAQYGLPSAANVIHLTLPITARKPDQLAAAARMLAPELEGLPRPLIGVLVGGPANPFSFGPDVGERLLRGVLEFAAARGGTLLVATSPRTPQDVTGLLAQGLRSPHRLFPFVPDAGATNDYPALLALADLFVVTGDSISMIADAVHTGKEVRLFEPGLRKPRPSWQPAWPPAHWLDRRRTARIMAGKAPDFLDRWFEGEVRAGRATPVRHGPVIVRRLLAEGHLAALGSPDGPRAGLGERIGRELDAVVARILALTSARGAGGPPAPHRIE